MARLRTRTMAKVRPFIRDNRMVSEKRHYTHWGKIEGSNLRKSAGLHSHLLGHSWIGHFISSKCVSIFAQSAPNMSIYSSIRREFCKIGLRDAGVATGPDGPLFPSGKRSTEKKHRHGDCCIRQEY
jgi:hypothetical protein